MEPAESPRSSGMSAGSCLPPPSPLLTWAWGVLWVTQSQPQPCTERGREGRWLFRVVCDKKQLPRMPHSPCGRHSLPRSWGLPGGCFGAGLPPSAIGVVERAQIGQDSCPLNPARPQAPSSACQLLLGFPQGQLRSPWLDQGMH